VIEKFTFNRSIRIYKVLMPNFMSIRNEELIAQFDKNRTPQKFIGLCQVT